jgi:radical SAM superfamily enzyme YgiQ (UPF0313 family)
MSTNLDYKNTVVLVSTVQDLVYDGVREKSYEHVGIGYLASFLRQQNYDLHIYYVYESEDNHEALERITRHPCVLMGFNAYAVTIKKVLELCELVKAKNPDVHICLGAQTPTFEDKTILKKSPCVDSIIRGEGELTLNELVYRVKNNLSLSDVNGLTYRYKDEIVTNPDREEIKNLDDLPWPARDEHDKNNNNIFVIETSRGCLGRCSFCTAHDDRYFGRKKWRGRSVENVVNEIEYLVNKYQARMFNIIDASFEDPGEEGKQRMADFANAIIERGLNISYVVDFRSESISDKDSELLDLLIKSGLEGVVLGLESGSENILKLFSKRATVQDNERITRILFEKRLGFLHNIIMFQPYTTCDELRENTMFLKRCNLAYRFEDFQTRLQVQPGIQLKAKMVQDGLIPENIELTTNLLDYKYVDARIKPFADAMASIIPKTNLEMEFFDLNVQIFNLRLRKLPRAMEIWTEITDFEDKLHETRVQLSNSNSEFFLKQIDMVENNQWSMAKFEECLQTELIQPVEEAKKKIRLYQKEIIRTLIVKGFNYRKFL